jgi:hypothetical protein
LLVLELSLRVLAAPAQLPAVRQKWLVLGRSEGQKGKMGQLGVHLCGFREPAETRPAQAPVSVGVSKASAWGQARVSWPDHETGDV